MYKTDFDISGFEAGGSHSGQSLKEEDESTHQDADTKADILVSDSSKPSHRSVKGFQRSRFRHFEALQLLC